MTSGTGFIDTCGQAKSGCCLKQILRCDRYQVPVTIIEAKEIIFFGHSINEMDFCYFREFFKVASASTNLIRHLTIITYDENSERDIKDNIRNQGISVSDLYSNLWTFDFIHTKKNYSGIKEDEEKWNGMMNRLMAKDRHGI